MDLPCLQWQDHVAQKWIGLNPELKETFISVEDIDDLYKCAQSLTTQDDVDFMQAVCAASSVQKDSDRAAESRERGNCSFRTRDYPAAALHYSQGICLAPPGSEQLSLCYANRSAALYHLQLRQECLADIDEALRTGYPPHLAHKLQSRRAACLQDRPPAGQEAGEGELSPAHRSREGPSVQLCPGAAVSSSVERGRHLVAVDRMAAGEEILREGPYGCVLLPGVQGLTGKQGETRREAFGTESRRCHRCLAQTLSPAPCGGCSYSRYCSPGCRAEAWEEHHRWECPLGAELLAMGAMLQLALRVALKAGLKNVRKARAQNGSESRGSGADPSSCDSYLSVFHLLHHLRRHSPAMRFLCAVSVAAVCLRLGQAGPPPASWTLKRRAADGVMEDEGDSAWNSEAGLLGSTVLRHMLQLRCNAQAVVALQDAAGAGDAPVQSSREVRLASAMFPTLSLLNHSCRPNTSLAFATGTRVAPRGSEASADRGARAAEDRRPARGVTVTVRAARDIPPGQEILHCYGPHSSRMVIQQRQLLLQEQYFFLCQCEACSPPEEEEEEEEDGEERRPGARGAPRGSALLCCECQGSLERNRDDGGSGFVCSLPSCGRRLSASDVRKRLQEVGLGLERAVELLEGEEPGEALKLLERTRRQAGRILAETHPLRGELADATARAYATMGDWENAASQLERSVAAIASQYGEDSVELARQLFKLAQLHFNGAARGPALSVIPKVRRLLGLHLGPGSPELQELQAMEDCLRG